MNKTRVKFSCFAEAAPAIWCSRTTECRQGRGERRHAPANVLRRVRQAKLCCSCRRFAPGKTRFGAGSWQEDPDAVYRLSISLIKIKHLIYHKIGDINIKKAHQEELRGNGFVLPRRNSQRRRCVFCDSIRIKQVRRSDPDEMENTNMPEALASQVLPRDAGAALV